MHLATHFLQFFFILLLSVVHPLRLSYGETSISNTTNITNVTDLTSNPVQISSNSTIDNSTDSDSTDTNNTYRNNTDRNSTDRNSTDSNSASDFVSNRTSSNSTNSSDPDANVITIAPTPSNSTNSSIIVPSCTPSSSIPSPIPSLAPTNEASYFNSNSPTLSPTVSPSISAHSPFPSLAPSPQDGVFAPTTDDDHEFTTNPTNSPTIYMSSFDRYISSIFSLLTHQVITCTPNCIKKICGYRRNQSSTSFTICSWDKSCHFKSWRSCLLSTQVSTFFHTHKAHFLC